MKENKIEFSNNIPLELIQYEKKHGKENAFKLFADNFYAFNNQSDVFLEKINNFEIVDFSKKKLATMIAGNKTLSHELELYSERVNTIKYFEKYFLENTLAQCYKIPDETSRPGFDPRSWLIFFSLNFIVFSLMKSFLIIYHF